MKYFTEVGKQSSNFELNKDISHFNSGKDAISHLLNELKLSNTDEVLINSTFDTRYVSSCVTSTIFNYCKPSKVLTKFTKLIFVIHDFGIPNENVFYLKSVSEARGIPLIEDCAQSAFSFFKNKARIGTVGNYAIYSLKKIVPIDNVGLLIDNKSSVFPYLEDVKQAAEMRRNNYQKLANIFRSYDILPYLDIDEKISPYVFPFQAPKNSILKRIKAANQIDLIYWVNLDLYTIPTHQLLDEKYFDLISKKLSGKSNGEQKN